MDYVICKSCASILLTETNSFECLCKIAITGHTECMHVLHERIPDVSARDTDNTSILHLCELYSVDMFKTLLYLGYDVNDTRRDGCTPMMCDVSLHHIKLLLSNNANPNIQDNDGNTALHLTTTNDVIQVLLLHGADVNLCNSMDMTPLHWKVYRMLDIPVDKMKESNICNILNCIVTFTDTDPILINKKDIFGNTPLHYAEYSCIIQLLVECGGDISMTNHINRTLFHILVRNHDALVINSWIRDTEHVNYMIILENAINTVLKYGININAPDRNGKTVLHCAQIPSTVDKLLKLGANINCMAIGGVRPLHQFLLRLYNILHRIRMEQYDIRRFNEINTLLSTNVACIMNMYLDAGYDINSVDDNGNTLMHIAPCELVVDMLVDRGLSVNTLNALNQSALFSTDNGSMINVLVKHGIKLNSVDTKGRTVLHYAKNIDHIKTMIGLGLDVNARDDYGYTPLYNACTPRLWSDVCRLLRENGATIYNIYIPNTVISVIKSDTTFLEYFQCDRIKTLPLLEEISSDACKKLYSDTVVKEYLPKCIVSKYWHWI